uniref:3'-5' exonuclease domain-containing protein n=1 Tax=Rhabditophanes sp. KR3021 TaxID=114890 RepID=A0AC35TQL4_9BILA
MNVTNDEVKIFIQEIENCPHSYADLKKIFQKFNDVNMWNIKYKKARKLGDQQAIKIFEAVYEITKIEPEFNKVWGEYCNILKYNDKKVRPTLINKLENDAENHEVIPIGVLELVFGKVIKGVVLESIKDKNIFLQYLVQSSNADYSFYDCIKYPIRKEILSIIEKKYKPLTTQDEEKSIEAFTELKADVFGNSLYNCDPVKLMDYLQNSRFNMHRLYLKLTLIDLHATCVTEAITSKVEINTLGVRIYGKAIKQYLAGKMKEELLMDNLFECFLYNQGCLNNIIKLFPKNSRRSILSELNGWCGFKDTETLWKHLNEKYLHDAYPRAKSSTLARKNMYVEKLNAHGEKERTDFRSLIFLEDQNKMKLLPSKDAKVEVVFVESDAQLKEALGLVMAFKDTSDSHAFLEVKFSQSEGFEELEIICIQFGDILNIIKVRQLDNYEVSDYLGQLFSMESKTLVGFQIKKMKKKLGELFKLVPELDSKFEKATNLVCLVDILQENTCNEKLQKKMVRMFPKTWHIVFKSDSKVYLENKSSTFICGETEDVNPERLKIIRNKHRDVTFAELCFLSTSHIFDDSEDHVLSYWQRQPLRHGQEESLKTKMLGIVLIYESLVNLENSV